MARFQSQAKMQYYPTPPAIAEAIARSLIRSAPGLIRAIDPACGEGTALCLATGLLGDPVERYGIELNQERAEVARGVLTRILRTDIRSTRVANDAFGLLFLNPPYDFDIPALDEAAQRLELYFLQAAVRYLAVGGILVYLIPDRRLNSKIANLLAYHFERIQVFRFPGEAYSPYQQIVLFADTLGSRVTKFKHTAREAMQVGTSELVILTELLLRGPQTTGELRGRASRMHELGSLEEVRNLLQHMMELAEPLAQGMLDDGLRVG